MRGAVGRRALGLSALLALAALPLTATPAQAAAPGLAITAPASVSLGTVTVGSSSISASLGTVRVSTASAVLHLASWTATVSTSGFTTGGGSAAELVPAGSVSYQSGPATAQAGLALNACAPGQLLAQPLSVPREAFSCAGLSLLSSTSLSWNPTLVVSLPPGLVTGAYLGTITHSVA